MKNKKEKKINDIKDTDRAVKRHHLWGGIGLIIGIVIAILLIASFSYKYIHFVERQSYIKGGEDMAKIIYDNIDENGGGSIEIGNEKIVLAKYEKPVTVEMMVP